MSKIIEDLRDTAEIRRVISDLPDDALVDQNYASEILKAFGWKYTPRTLRKLRSISSTGPRYQKAPNGRVRYTLGDLKRFASSTAG